MRQIAILCLVLTVIQCTNSTDEARLEKKTTVTRPDSIILPIDMTYTQKEGRDEIATILLQHDHLFKFNDMRDGSCYVWSTTFGDWEVHDDTLILSPKREANSYVKLQTRRFFMKNDSLIFIKFRQKNPDINWGNYKLKVH